ncbi:MAG TPA: Na(+)/H(+) antiporter subunit B [Candidatus Acidoferrales bacterium]|nr:Na(+)/H(+) antiporter subunit B [Candidatus Acidoferrales bacterium]
MKDRLIIRVVTKITTPFILVFGFYVITHGELSPGGGFQGGVLLAAAFILYGLVFGLDELEPILPRRVSDSLAAIGVLLYAGLGLVGIFTGYRFLDYRSLGLAGSESAEVWGMALAEYGVGITVTAVMITIFREVAQAKRREH